mgnify:CR=1 FL=1
MLFRSGSLEADLMFRLARRNKIDLRWKTEDELRAAYKFTCLQDFLDVYYAGLTVLLTEQDFYDMTWAYLETMHRENVLHVEVFISPQAHTRRNVPSRAARPCARARTNTSSTYRIGSPA